MQNAIETMSTVYHLILVMMVFGVINIIWNTCVDTLFTVLDANRYMIVRDWISSIIVTPAAIISILYWFIITQNDWTIDVTVFVLTLRY